MYDLLNQVLNDPMRLQTIKSLAIFDSPSELAFDRLTRLASKIVGAPVSLVSLVDNKRQWFKSMVGLPEPWASQRETPLSHSFCQHVVATNKPLVVTDAREVSFLKTNLAIPDLNVIAYLGMPLTTREGFGLGSFCVIDSKPRVWTDTEIEIMGDLADTAMSLIDMRGQLVSLHYMAEDKLMRADEALDAAKKEHQTMVSTVTQMLESQKPTSEVLAYLH
jgi:GAF domain-containing protein